MGFEHTTTGFRSDALTNWAIRPWFQLALRANFVQLLRFHRLFSVTFHFGYCLHQSPRSFSSNFCSGNHMSVAEWMLSIFDWIWPYLYPQLHWWNCQTLINKRQEKRLEIRFFEIWGKIDLRFLHFCKYKYNFSVWRYSFCRIVCCFTYFTVSVTTIFVFPGYMFLHNDVAYSCIWEKVARRKHIYQQPINNKISCLRVFHKKSRYVTTTK